MVSCCLPSTGCDLLVVGWVVPSISVVAVEVPVDSRMTIVRTVIVVVSCFATWKSVECDSVVSKR